MKWTDRQERKIKKKFLRNQNMIEHKSMVKKSHEIKLNEIKRNKRKKFECNKKE